MRAVVQRFKRTRRGAQLADNPLANWAWLRTQSLPHYARRGHAARTRIVEAYLRDEPDPRLHIGCGPVQIPGWLNSDLRMGAVYLDLTRPLPLPSHAFRHAFGEHIIEHLTETDGRRLLAELFRVVRPGGVVRITTPDLRKILALYEDTNPAMPRAEYARFLDEITGKTHERPAQVFNDFMHQWGHLWIYDEEDLAAKLREAGFVDIVRHESGVSDHAHLRDIEHHGPVWENDVEAMCLEATKPVR